MKRDPATAVTPLRDASFVGPQDPPRFWLHVDGELRGQVVLDGERLVLGRGNACDVLVDDEAVSNDHLELSRHGGAVLATDLGSRNGTRLNGQRLDRPTRLRHGDTLALGATRLQLVLPPVAGTSKPRPRRRASRSSPIRSARWRARWSRRSASRERSRRDRRRRAEIAEAVHLSERTVQRRLDSLSVKLGLPSHAPRERAHLLAHADPRARASMPSARGPPRPSRRHGGRRGRAGGRGPRRARRRRARVAAPPLAAAARAGLTNVVRPAKVAGYTRGRRSCARRSARGCSRLLDAAGRGRVLHRCAHRRAVSVAIDRADGKPARTKVYGGMLRARRRPPAAVLVARLAGGDAEDHLRHAGRRRSCASSRAMARARPRIGGRYAQPRRRARHRRVADRCDSTVVRVTRRARSWSQDMTRRPPRRSPPAPTTAPRRAPPPAPGAGRDAGRRQRRRARARASGYAGAGEGVQRLDAPARR